MGGYRTGRADPVGRSSLIVPELPMANPYGGTLNPEEVTFPSIYLRLKYEKGSMSKIPIRERALRTSRESKK